MSQMLGIVPNCIDQITLKMRQSGEVYVDTTALGSLPAGISAAASGVWNLAADGTLTTKDTSTGTTYKLIVTSAALVIEEV